MILASKRFLIIIYSRLQIQVMSICPDSYCCSNNKTCEIYNTCNTGRTGTLCGSCKNNWTESLFSTKCIPHGNCFTKTIFISYLVHVFIYGIGLLVFQVLKKKHVVHRNMFEENDKEIFLLHR